MLLDQTAQQEPLVLKDHPELLELRDLMGLLGQQVHKVRPELTA